MKKYLIIGRRFENTRIALECDTKEVAVERLNKAADHFRKINNNLWIDNLGQEFYITEKDIEDGSR